MLVSPGGITHTQLRPFSVRLRQCFSIACFDRREYSGVWLASAAGCSVLE